MKQSIIKSQSHYQENPNKLSWMHHNHPHQNYNTLGPFKVKAISSDPSRKLLLKISLFEKKKQKTQTTLNIHHNGHCNTINIPETYTQSDTSCTTYHTSVSCTDNDLDQEDIKNDTKHHQNYDYDDNEVIDNETKYYQEFKTWRKYQIFDTTTDPGPGLPGTQMINQKPTKFPVYPKPSTKSKNKKTSPRVVSNKIVSRKTSVKCATKHSMIIQTLSESQSDIFKKYSTFKLRDPEGVAEYHQQSKGVQKYCDYHQVNEGVQIEGGTIVGLNDINTNYLTVVKPTKSRSTSCITASTKPESIIDLYRTDLRISQSYPSLDSNQLTLSQFSAQRLDPGPLGSPASGESFDSFVSQLSHTENEQVIRKHFIDNQNLSNDSLNHHIDTGNDLLKKISIPTKVTKSKLLNGVFPVLSPSGEQIGSLIGVTVCDSLKIGKTRKLRKISKKTHFDTGGGVDKPMFVLNPKLQLRPRSKPRGKSPRLLQYKNHDVYQVKTNPDIFVLPIDQLDNTRNKQVKVLSITKAKVKNLTSNFHEPVVIPAIKNQSLGLQVQVPKHDLKERGTESLGLTSYHYGQSKMKGSRGSDGSTFGKGYHRQTRFSGISGISGGSGASQVSESGASEMSKNSEVSKPLKAIGFNKMEDVPEVSHLYLPKGHKFGNSDQSGAGGFTNSKSRRNFSVLNETRRVRDQYLHNGPTNPLGSVSPNPDSETTNNTVNIYGQTTQGHQIGPGVNLNYNQACCSSAVDPSTLNFNYDSSVPITYPSGSVATDGVTPGSHYCYKAGFQNSTGLACGSGKEAGFGIGGGCEGCKARKRKDYMNYVFNNFGRHYRTGITNKNILDTVDECGSLKKDGKDAQTFTNYGHAEKGFIAGDDLIEL